MPVLLPSPLGEQPSVPSWVLSESTEARENKGICISSCFTLTRASHHVLLYFGQDLPAVTAASRKRDYYHCCTGQQQVHEGRRGDSEWRLGLRFYIMLKDQHRQPLCRGHEDLVGWPPLSLWELRQTFPSGIRYPLPGCDKGRTQWKSHGLTGWSLLLPPVIGIFVQRIKSLAG